MPIKHAYVSTKSDPADSSLIGKSKWDDDHIIQLQTKAGTPTDADIIEGAAPGNVIVDTAGNKAWFRVGITWMSVALSGGGGGGGGSAGIYGTGLAMDSNSNFRIGGPDSSIVSLRFRASTSSSVTAVVLEWRVGVGYSGTSSNGTIRVGIKADDGTGKPTGAYLCSLDYSHASLVNDHYIVRSTFSAPATLVAGTLYHMVLTNVDASPTVNYISINNTITMVNLVPRQPAYPDADYCSLYNVAGGGFTEYASHTPILDVEYADGKHDGMGYVQPARDHFALMSGTTTMARCHFTVTGGARTVSQVFLRVGRTSGTAPLSIRLETSAGTEIETVSIPAASVPVVPTPGADYAITGTWVGAAFASSHVLANGQTYNLRFSCAAGTEYSVVPAAQRDYCDDGTHYLQSRQFTDGRAQYTTDSGGTWPVTYSRVHNWQFYFVTA
jgi:hypothetical protein